MKKSLQKNPVAVLLAGLLMVLGSFALTGCQTSSTENIRFSSVPGEEEMTGVPTAEGARLAPGDPIHVAFSGLADPIPSHDEQIKEDGTITLPNIGAVKAEGKTTGELQKEIHDKYVPAFYKRLTVTVSTERRVYYVQGQVRASGRQEYLGPTTVLKAIATAGDFTDFADRTDVIVTRTDGTQIHVNCNKAAKDSRLDLPIYPGDKIEVKLRDFKSIFR